MLNFLQIAQSNLKVHTMMKTNNRPFIAHASMRNDDIWPLKSSFIKRMEIFAFVVSFWFHVWHLCCPFNLEMKSIWNLGSHCHTYLIVGLYNTEWELSALHCLLLLYLRCMVHILWLKALILTLNYLKFSPCAGWWVDNPTKSTWNNHKTVIIMDYVYCL